jgi:hypothetical protein
VSIAIAIPIPIAISMPIPIAIPIRTKGLLYVSVGDELYQLFWGLTLPGCGKIDGANKKKPGGEPGRGTSHERDEEDSMAAPEHLPGRRGTKTRINA